MFFFSRSNATHTTQQSIQTQLHGTARTPANAHTHLIIATMPGVCELCMRTSHFNSILLLHLLLESICWHLLLVVLLLLVMVFIAGTNNSSTFIFRSFYSTKQFLYVFRLKQAHIFLIVDIFCAIRRGTSKQQEKKLFVLAN